MANQTVISTSQKTQVLDVTEECQSLIGAAENGIAVFNVLHTTAALTLGENDSDLFDDMARAAENLLSGMRPFRHGRYSNPNAEAHILSVFAGSSLTLPIANGKLILGTWQRILLLEFDGPKRRKLVCTTAAAT